MRRIDIRRTLTDPGRGSRGQVAVIFAGAVLLFALLCAAVVDLSWYWTNNLRMQRAADAAALAGVVFLPGDPTSATNVARAEAVKNGFTNGSGGVVVTPSQDPSNPRRLRVTISGPVGTFFARAVGISSWPARRDAKAEYVLPVPMGSPENYYGVFGLVRHPGGGVTQVDTDTGTTSYFDPTTVPGGNWTNPTNAYVDETSAPINAATRNSTTNPHQLWGGFGVTLPSGGGLTIDGIEVEVDAQSNDSSGCTLRAALNWTGTTNPTSGSMTSMDTVNLTGTYQNLQFGGPTDTWGRTWTATELNNANLRIRLTYTDPGTNCTNGAVTSVDHVHVRIYWTQTTSTFIPDSNLTGPSGQALNPRGFWATMLTQGADDVNGDAYLPANEQGGGDSNPEYSPSKYYDYAV
ncbi:MAG TPA: pilus assembly protein TadG-related protein, partial [Candidatus Limnocylindrales bacterium]